MNEMPVNVIRSSRRTRTLQARVVDGTIQVRVPEGMPPDEEDRMVSALVDKVRRKLNAGFVDLDARARRLADRHDLPLPDSITWSDRQNHRWGSCTTGARTIRISNRLAGVPDFVLDYVIVHELAHLVVSGHGPRFRSVEDRYPLAERARGYLMALQHTNAA